MSDDLMCRIAPSAGDWIDDSTRLTLPFGEVHVFYLFVADFVDGFGYDALLAPAERARRDRYVYPRNQIEYLLTRTLVRTTLSRYAQVSPVDWIFCENQYGKPEIDLPALRWLRFNLSNTDGLVACAVARECDVGIDVEDCQRDGETVLLADRFFSPSEAAALRALPEERQRSRFFDLWTLKEAYIKARGMGLAIPLDQFSFSFSFSFSQSQSQPHSLLGMDAGSDAVHIDFDPRLADEPAAWQFRLFDPSSRYRAAVALRRGSGPTRTFVVRRVVPAESHTSPQAQP